MKIKKIRETLKKAQDAVEQANNALADVMEELDDETMNKVSGAGNFNPFGDVPRVPLQELTTEQRENA